VDRNDPNLNTSGNTRNITKEHRASIFNALLEKSGVPSWGRATRISDDLGISQATASGWLNGSLPRDCGALLNCADKYDIDVHEWVSGTARGKGLNLEKLERNVQRLHEHILAHSMQLNAAQSAKLIVMLYEDEEKADYLLKNIGIFLQQNKMQ
tara:strand:- start:2792 stop:3253 length:462 start_codon:yes stop_codon:yes gene_type:complete